MSSYRILIVEDEGLIAHDLAERLTSLGHTVAAVVETGEEAVTQASGVELVLMDIRLDGAMDGIEAAASIRDRHRIPVVFLTAHADRTTLERAKLTDPFGYLVKPLAQATLQSTIEIAVYRHRMERQLAEREAWFRAVLSAISDAVIATDIAGRVRSLNGAAEALLDCPQAEVLGKPAPQMLPLRDADSGEPVVDSLPLAILGDASVTLPPNVQLAVKSGRRMMVEGAVAPVKDSGEILGAVLTLRDVTARRWQEQQLRQAHDVDAAGRLAASVAAEFTNLLAIIRGQTEQLERQFAGYTGVREPLAEIQQATAAAEAITRRLTGFGGPKTGTREGLSLNGLVRRMSKLIESAAGATVATALRPLPAAGKILADAAQIEQMLMNVVLHARSAMPDGGRLLIETANVERLQQTGLAPQPHDFVRLTVTHSGETQNLENLFDPSSPANLGLSIAHSIATEHGGYLSAERTAEGGVRFDFLLPRWREPAPLAVPDAIAKASLLLIDPNDVVRRHLHNYFEAHGFNLLEAVDASEAAALLELSAQSPDLVVADAREAESLAERCPDVRFLRVVASEPASPAEIGRPFTQSQLLERVTVLLQQSSPKHDARSAQVSTA